VERIRKGRSLSLSQEREKGNGDGRSERPGRSSAIRVDTSSRRHGRNGDSKTKVKTRAPDRDFLKLIPNFDSMVSKNLYQINSWRHVRPDDVTMSCSFC
jgi:hypothetical protein